MKSFQLKLLLQRNDQWVNNHNGFSLLHWGAKVIVGPYSAAAYCCLYSSKGEAPDAILLSNTMLKSLANEKLFGNNSKKLYQSANSVFSSLSSVCSIQTFSCWLPQLQRSCHW